MTTMNALNGPQIRHAEFVKLSIGPFDSPTQVYTFCNAAAPVTVSGTTYSNLGSLLSVGDVQRDIKATSDDMTIALTGLDPANIGLILSNNIKGSVIEMWRGFLDSNNQIITTPNLQFFKRYQGLINNVSITESFDERARTRIATCSMSCSSMRRIIENRIAGIKTNQKSWQQFYPNDVSMNRTAEIQSTFFDFGAPPKTQTQTQPSDNTNGTDVTLGSSGGGE
jgi:hypothetical protein